MTHAHQTAATRFVEANDIRFAYRRFGKAGGVPIVFNLHYRGTMDYWDPVSSDRVLTSVRLKFLRQALNSRAHLG
jgi:hypothetical protein